MHHWAEGVTVAFDRKNQALLVKFLLRGLTTETITMAGVMGAQIVSDIEPREAPVTQRQVEAVATQEPHISPADWETRNQVRGIALNMHADGFILNFHLLRSSGMIAIAMNPMVAHVFRVLLQRALEQLGIRSEQGRSRPN